MTANGLSSYELFVKRLTFSRQTLIFSAGVLHFSEKDVGFYENQKEAKRNSVQKDVLNSSPSFF